MESTAFGAALASGLAVGVYSLDDAEKFPHDPVVYRPQIDASTAEVNSVETMKRY